MKHIAFKTLPITNPAGQTGELNYRDYIELAIKSPIDQKSVGIEEMHKSIRLLNILEEADRDGVDFEDADHEYLCQKVNALGFKWVDPAFEQFVNDVTKPV